MHFFVIIFYFIFYCNAFSSEEHQNPYKVLGVRRDSSVREIKQAYKRLVKEWHPDKNDSPEASDKFMALTRAYELLIDPVRKERYDRYGAYDTLSQPDYNSVHGFEEMFNYAFGGGEFGNGGSKVFFKHRITNRKYSNVLLEKSYTQPVLIYAYSTYCQVCHMLEPIWKEAVENLESLGYGIGTVNYVTDGNLFEKLRVSYLPSICVLVEERVIHYRANINNLSSKAISLFAKDAIPNTFLLRINNYDSLRRFLDQWKTTNKPSVLILGAKEEPRLRYLLLAMKMSHFARFAYINLNYDNFEVKEIKSALKISCSNCENILIFNEYPENGPIAKISSNLKQFTMDEMSALLNKHKFLQLPRISSMQFFDELCPVSSRLLKHLCVLLPINNNNDKEFVKLLQHFLEKYGNQLQKDRISIATIFINRQQDFMSKFQKNFDQKVNAKSILVLWRFEHVKAKYYWLINALEINESIVHETFEKLKKNLYSIIRGHFRMENTGKIVNVVDEYAPSWFTRLSRRAIRMAETLWFHVTKEELLPIISVAGTLFFIFFFGYGLNYLVNESQNNKDNTKKKSTFLHNETKEWHPDDPKTQNINKNVKNSTKKRYWKEMEPMIHELKGDTFNGLIRSLKPGCRSIIILVDSDTKEILLPKFARSIYILKNNKTFSFGYLMVDKNLSFFRSLLEYTLPEDNESISSKYTSVNSDSENFVNETDLQKQTAIGKNRLKYINPKQTLGTVLVICNWKFYFLIYHPMHKPSSTKINDNISESESETDFDEKLLIEKKNLKKFLKKKNVNINNVLDGFSLFLNKMLDGSGRRYLVPEWPKNLI